MYLLQTDPEAATDPTLLVGMVVFVALVAMGGLLVYLTARLRRQTEALEGLARLEAIEGLLRQVAGRGEELDLRRLEHVLIDLRDGQRRLEERLVRLLEAPAAEGPAPAGAPRPTSLSERVATRLLSMGYERIEVLTPLEDLEALEFADEGEVIVEARRGGALHKGRVLVKDGAICDVRLRSSYEIFP